MNAGEYYQKRALKYGISEGRKAKILQLIDCNLAGKAVLDLGCATGYLGRIIKQKGAEVIGVDISRDAVQKARKYLTDAKVVDLNKERLPFGNQKFDVLVAAEVLEHLLTPELLLKEANRVLKDSGELIVSTPNFLYWGNRTQFLKGVFHYEESGVFDRGHIHFYTYQTLKEDLLTAGFKIIDENHVYAGGNRLNIFRDTFPSFFAHQFVIKCKKA